MMKWIIVLVLALFTIAALSGVIGGSGTDVMDHHWETVIP